MAIKAVGVFLIAVVLSGCYSFSSMTKIPEISESIIVEPTGSKNNKIGYVAKIEAKYHCMDPPCDGFEKEILGKLKQSNYFNNIVYGLKTNKPEEPVYDLSFIIEENMDANHGVNLIKGLLIHFSAHLLEPALPHTYDFSADHYLLATRPDGTRREYKASCAGSASATYTYPGVLAEYRKMAGAASARCLTSVINQFTADISGPTSHGF